jgi:RNA polymerase sigma-70 factor, ECF subfamily
MSETRRQRLATNAGRAAYKTRTSTAYPPQQRRRAACKTSADGRLGTRAAAGDELAFAELYARYGRRMYWLCLRMVHDIALAEDLTQEAFMQAYRRLKTYRADAAFSTWLHRVTVNVVLMYLRKTRNRTEFSLEELTDSDQNGGRQSAELNCYDGALAGCVDRIALERAIDELAPGYRMCFILHDVEGYEHHEVAELLGVAEGSSKSQLHKARMRLRELLYNKP